MGERYKNIAKETEGVLKGEYGTTPSAVDASLQARVLDGAEAVTCRPADLLEPEFESLKTELISLEKEKGLKFGKHIDDDVLTYALFPQVGLNFLANRDNAEAFEPVPGSEPELLSHAPASASQGSGVYTVDVEGERFVVQVTDGGDVAALGQVNLAPVSQEGASTGAVSELPAPLAGNVFKVPVSQGQSLAEGDVVVVLEAMKMETEIRASRAGTVSEIHVREGDAVKTGDVLVTLV